MKMKLKTEVVMDRNAKTFSLIYELALVIPAASITSGDGVYPRLPMPVHLLRCIDEHGITGSQLHRMSHTQKTREEKEEKRNLRHFETSY